MAVKARPVHPCTCSVCGGEYDWSSGPDRLAHYESDEHIVKALGHKPGNENGGGFVMAELIQNERRHAKGGKTRP